MSHLELVPEGDDSTFDIVDIFHDSSFNLECSVSRGEKTK